MIRKWKIKKQVVNYKGKEIWCEMQKNFIERRKKWVNGCLIYYRNMILSNHRMTQFLIDCELYIQGKKQFWYTIADNDKRNQWN
jgi:hypothetical protein